jgi:hypothetical protein
MIFFMGAVPLQEASISFYAKPPQTVPEECPNSQSARSLHPAKTDSTAWEVSIPSFSGGRRLFQVWYQGKEHSIEETIALVV